MGAAKSGKTTLAEDMLFEGGKINRRGSVDDKNTVRIKIGYQEIHIKTTALYDLEAMREYLDV